MTKTLVAALALGLALTVGVARAAAPADDTAALSALLKQQTQAFSEAGVRGDRAVMDRLLDPDVVFTNETGSSASKQDLVEGTTPTPASAPKRHIEVTNWALRRQGEVATATFIDVLTQDIGGQTLVLRFQSTETWARRPDGWKMIASHTMNVVAPPAEVILPPAALDDYVGAYQAGPAYVVRIARDGDALTASANGGPPSPLKAELRDVLFSPGSPNVRKIFQRDAAGRVVAYINRRDGSDLVFRKVG